MQRDPVFSKLWLMHLFAARIVHAHSCVHVFSRLCGDDSKEYQLKEEAGASYSSDFSCKLSKNWIMKPWLTCCFNKLISWAYDVVHCW